MRSLVLNYMAKCFEGEQKISDLRKIKKLYPVDNDFVG